MRINRELKLSDIEEWGLMEGLGDILLDTAFEGLLEKVAVEAQRLSEAQTRKGIVDAAEYLLSQLKLEWEDPRWDEALPDDVRGMTGRLVVRIDDTNCEPLMSKTFAFADLGTDSEWSVESYPNCGQENVIVALRAEADRLEALMETKGAP